MKKQSFAAGQKVKLIRGGNRPPLYGFTSGSQYEIMALPGGDAHDCEYHSEKGRIAIKGGSEGDGIGYAFPSQLQHIAPVIEFTVGQLVKVVSGGGRFPLEGFRNGETFVITHLPYSPDFPDCNWKGNDKIRITKLDGSPTYSGSTQGFATADQLAPVFKAGDKIRGKSSGDIYTLRAPDLGREPDERGKPWKVDEAGGWVGEHQFELVEESAQDEPEQPFKVGDKFKLLSGGGVHPLYGATDGMIYTVEALPGDESYSPSKSGSHYSAGRVQFRNDNKSRAFALPSQMELVEESAPEVEQPETATPGRIQVGDRVEIVGGINDGATGVVVQDDESSVPFEVQVDGLGDTVWKKAINVRKIEPAAPATDSGTTEVLRLLQTPALSDSEKVIAVKLSAKVAGQEDPFLAPGMEKLSNEEKIQLLTILLKAAE